MQKEEERKALDSILGIKHDLLVIESESPDFLLSNEDDIKLGVEVTEIYSNQVDAKLRHLPDYTSKLLDGSANIHRADLGKIDVKEFTIKDKDGKVKGSGLGIMRDIPSILERIETLESAVKAKEKKIASYHRQARNIDLILQDSSRMFFHTKFEEFFKPFSMRCEKDIFLNTGFREIFLITHNKVNESVNIPLKGNLFFADCFAYESFLFDENGVLIYENNWLDIFLAALYLSGYGSVNLAHSEDEISLFFGSWELAYTPGGKNIRDRVLVFEEYPKETIESVKENWDTESIEIAETFIEQRKTVYSAMEITFPCRAE